MNDILAQYNSSEKGLTAAEAQKRQNEYGPNMIEEVKPTPAIFLFLSQFVDILITLLIIAAVASFAIGDVIDGCIILIAVLLNTVIGFIQEYRSQKAVESLKSFMTRTAVVKRDGKILEIDSRELTVGDVIILNEGDKIPADGIIINQKDLSCDESQLTGESEAILKNPRDEIFMDSNVISGRCEAVITDIGMNTQIGRIAEVVQEEDEDTPLKQRVSRLGKVLSVISIIVCIAIFILELSSGETLVETFMTAVSLAVAAIPEGLPAVLTLTLALGMNEMAKSNAIVKRLLSVETLGSCTVICSDKTGTLTQNRMTVVESFFTNQEKTSLIGCECNNASIMNGEIIGNQTDGAILKFFENRNYGLERLDEIPLCSDRKRMTTIHRLDGEKNMVLTKGAPEIIIDECKFIDDEGTIKNMEPEIKEMLLEKVGDMTENALRTLAFAYKIEDENPLEENLIFTGLVGLIDPPKKDAKKAIAECKNAGIKVVMITGDHEQTACAIAGNLGILTDGKTITGEKFDELNDEEYMKIAEDIQVYARVKPVQKMRIVETLKDLGNIVAMTGDGINDAPALKKASIGVAMGDGTDVTKESADMILENNDFTSIVNAIRQGRKIYDNIKRFVKFQVSTNVGAILTIVGTSLLSLPLPFNPVQLLWLNIVMDGPPAQTLGMEGEEANLMSRPPETGDIITRNTLAKIMLTGIVMAIGTIAVFAYEINTGAGKPKAMTMAFTLFVLYQLFNAYNRKANSTQSSRYLYMAIILSFLLQVLIIYIPQLQIIFRTAPIGLADWAAIIIIAATILVTERIINRVIK